MTVEQLDPKVMANLTQGQRDRLASQKAQMQPGTAGATAIVAAQQARAGAMTTALQGSATMNNYGAIAPDQIAAQQKINTQYGLPTGTGIYGNGGLAKAPTPTRDLAAEKAIVDQYGPPQNADEAKNYHGMVYTPEQLKQNILSGQTKASLYTPQELINMGIDPATLQEIPQGLASQMTAGVNPIYDTAALKAQGLSDEQIAQMQQAGGAANQAQGQVNSLSSPTNSNLRVLEAALNKANNVTNQSIGYSDLATKAGIGTPKSVQALTQSLQMRGNEMKQNYDGFNYTVHDAAGTQLDAWNAANTQYKNTIDQYNKTVDRITTLNADAVAQENALIQIKAKGEQDRLTQDAIAKIKATATIDLWGDNPGVGNAGPNNVNVSNDTIKDVFTLSGPSKYTSLLGNTDGARECGEGYNQITDGPHMGDNYKTEKMNSVTKQDNPQVGNALILPIGDPKIGHVETVIKSNLAVGTVTTVAWNLDLKGSRTVQTRNIADMNAKYGKNWGFNDSTLKPEYANKLQSVGTDQSTSSTKSTSQTDYAKVGLLSKTDYDPSKNLDKAAVHMIDLLFSTGTLPVARTMGFTGAYGDQKYNDAYSRAQQLYSDATGSSLPSATDVSNNMKLRNGNKKLLNALGTQEGQLSADFKSAIANLDKSGLNNSLQPINAFIDKYAQLAGNPDVALYLTTNSVLQNEMGNLLAIKNAGGTTVSDKINASGIFPTASTSEQMKAQLRATLSHAANAVNTLQNQNYELTKEIDPLQRDKNNIDRKTALYQPKSAIVNRFLADPNISQEQKDLTKKSLVTGEYDDVAWEARIKQAFPNKYDNPAGPANSPGTKSFSYSDLLKTQNSQDFSSNVNYNSY